MNLLHNKKIAIVGGGPGGLTLARLLQRKGADVKVYERDVNGQTRIQGGALDLHTESGLAALKEAGLMDAFKTNYRPGAEKIRIVDNQATILYDEHVTKNEHAFGDKHHRPEIDRGPLRDILLNSLQPGTVIWNRHFKTMESEGNSWKLLFQDGDPVIADIVIGADGAHSRIRPFVTAMKPAWVGVTLLEGVLYNTQKTAPRIHELLKGGKIFAFGNEKTLIVSSKGDGNFGFGLGLKTREDWVDAGIDFTDHRQVSAWFRKEFAEWGPVWNELFADEKALFIPRPQYCMPLNLTWDAQANVTLLGDAAHWMPPFAGEGVNMAMLDALQLSESLSDPSITELKKAIALYEKKMFARFTKVGRATLYNTRWMHSPAALKKMVSMFGAGLFGQISFLSDMWLEISLLPYVKKMFGAVPPAGFVPLSTAS